MSEETEAWKLLHEENQRAEKESKIPWLRASSMPAFFECSGVAMPVEHPYNPSNAYSTLGDACHEGMHLMLNGETIETNVLADKYDVDLVELEDALSAGVEVWESLSHLFPSAKPEVRVDGSFTGGTADVIHHDGKTAAVGDWKFGLVPRDHRYQVMSYATALVEEKGWPESNEIDAFIAYPRLDITSTYTITPDDIKDFKERYLDQVKSIGRQFGPGDACNWCPRQMVCGARSEYVVFAIASLSSNEYTVDDPEALADLYPRISMLEKTITQFRKVLRLYVSRFGALDLGDGKVLTQITVNNLAVDPKSAWPILLEHGFTEEDMNAVLSMSKEKVLKLYKDRHERGEKAKAGEYLMQMLAEANAIRKTSYHKLQKKKAPKK